MRVHRPVNAFTHEPVRDTAALFAATRTLTRMYNDTPGAATLALLSLTLLFSRRRR